MDQALNMPEMRLAHQVLEYLESRKEAMIDFLSQLVRTETPSGVPAAQEAIFELLADKLEEVAYTTVRVPGRKTGGYLYARPAVRPSSRAVQLMVGHCDTVWPIGTLESMPFQREAGRLRGPGVYDMKAGLTQMMFALETIHVLGLSSSVCPVVLINADEEIGSIESTNAIVRLARLCDRAYVLEPPLGPDGKLKTGRKGIGRFCIRVKGRAAHAGLDPEKGASAIVELSHQIQQLFAMNDPERGITVNVGMIEGGVSANVVAPESKAVIDVRVRNMKDAEKITQQIYDLKPAFPGTEIHIEGSLGRPPLERTLRNRKLWRLAKGAARDLGFQLEEGFAGGGSDGNTTSRYTATLDGLGTPGDGAHADHEFIFADQLTKRTALLVLLLLMEPVGEELEY
jgi:glutamate carboxypeptidase